MEDNKKSKFRIKLSPFKERGWEDVHPALGILGSVLFLPLMVLAIIRLHLYREPFFYLGVLALFGWFYIGRASERFKTRFTSKRAQNMENFVRFFLGCLLGLGGWAFFSYILGNRLGGGQFVLSAAISFFLTFGGILAMWWIVQKTSYFIRRSRRSAKKDMSG